MLLIEVLDIFTSKSWSVISLRLMQYHYHTSEVRRRVYICSKMLNDYLGMLMPGFSIHS
jgi:hypothetical protein